MIKAGEIHKKVMEERVPTMLKEGMTEGELTSGIFTTLQQEGHHGVSRFSLQKVGKNHLGS